MPRLTQKDMTESEQRQLKTLLDQERKKRGRTLTNAENNRIKDDYIDKLMKEREAGLAQNRRKINSNLMLMPPMNGLPIPMCGDAVRPVVM